MTYTTLLFDLDHTLFDTDASEAAAYAHTMASIGIDDPVAHFSTYDRINRGLWAGVERGELQPVQIRTRRFELLVAEVGLDADPTAMADTFVVALGAHGELYDGAEAVLDQLAASATMAIITNGLSEVQRARVARVGLDRWFDAVVVSSEVGVTKPRREIFDLTFELLGDPARDTALMVGDSLTSDIGGGVAAGVATCWYNPHGLVAGAEHRITHEIADLAELPTLRRP